MSQIDTLIVARAFTNRRATPARTLVQPLLRFGPRDRTESQWRDELLGAVERLRASAVIDEDHRLVDPSELARRIGKHAAKTWAQLADKILPALALGVAAADSKSHERLVGRDAWAAAIAARSLGLWTEGPPPSLAAVCDGYVWRSLGLPSKPKRCPPEVRAHFIQQALHSDAGPPERLVHLLAAKAIGVVRSDLRELRDGLVRLWVTEDHSLSVGKPAPPVEFAAEVRELSRHLRDGVFGDRKVFISSVWNQLRDQPRWSTLSLDEFKQRLVAAHRKGDLVLARADLVAAMDPELVAASETRTDGASFHFIVREAS